MRIFIICPVRSATLEQKHNIMKVVSEAEKEGHVVYYPARDTNQDDITGGWRICEDNATAIFRADEVWIWWDKNSKGSLFDLGVAFAYGKPLLILNQEDVDTIEGKAFENMITYWNFKSEEEDEDGN